MRKTNTPAPTRTDMALWVAGFAIAIFVALFATDGHAHAAPPLCDNSECTITVPPTTDVAPSTDVTTTAAPTTTTTVAPSTTTHPPAPSTSTTTTSVVVGPPPCTFNGGYPYIHDDQGNCQIDPCIADGRQYTWYYLAPPVDTPAWKGTTVGFVADCWVPIPQQLPVTGSGNTLPAVALLVLTVGAALVAVSRRKAA